MGVDAVDAAMSNAPKPDFQENKKQDDEVFWNQFAAEEDHQSSWGNKFTTEPKEPSYPKSSLPGAISSEL